MPNDVKLQEGHPVDENLRPLKVGGKSTAIETAQHGNGARINGDLEVTGDISGNITDVTFDDIVFDDITATSVLIDNDYSDTTAATIKALHVDLDRTGTVSTGTDMATGIDLDVTHTGASGGFPISTGIDLDVVGDAGGASAGIGFDVNVSGADTCTGISINNKDGGFDFINRSSADFLDFFTINTIEDGETTLTTFESGAGSTAHLNMVADGNFDVDAVGDVSLDSETGVFDIKKSGTKFADMYAGMMLGYTRIQNNSTTSGDGGIYPTATMTVLQTAQGTDIGVTFVVPPSGNVEIIFSGSWYGSSRTLELALSDNASFNEINETHTYDAGLQSSDETDRNMVVASWAVSGLTAGDSLTYYIAAAETVSGTSSFDHGRMRTTGTHYPPIIVKAIALPATIVTGE